MLLRVCQSLPHLIGVVTLSDGAGGTYHDALSAGYTGYFAQVLLKGTADMGLEATVVGADDANALQLGAGCHTAAAEDTLVVVPVHMYCRVIHFILDILTGIVLLIIHLEFPAELLQLTAACTHAGQTLLGMGGEDQFQGFSSGFEYTGAGGADLHTLGYRVNAGSYQAAGTLDFYHTDTAGADLIDLLEIAQGGNMNSGIPGRLQDCAAGGHGILLAVDFYIYHIHSITQPTF